MRSKFLLGWAVGREDNSERCLKWGGGGGGGVFKESFQKHLKIGSK